MANFSFDYDGCMSLQPEAFAAFSDALRAAGHKTYIVTMRYPSECKPLEPILKHFDGLHATCRMAKKPYLESQGIKINVWLEDTPRAVMEDAVAIWGYATKERDVITPDHEDTNSSPEIPPQATPTGRYNRSGPTGTTEECMAVAMRGLWRALRPNGQTGIIDTDSPPQAVPEDTTPPKAEPTLDKVLLEFEDASCITVLQRSTESSLPLVKIAEIAKSENSPHFESHWFFKHVVDFSQTYGVSEVWVVSAARLGRAVEPFTNETVTPELAVVLCCPKTYGVISEFYKKKQNVGGRQFIELLEDDSNSGHFSAFTAISLLDLRMMPETDWPWA